MNNSQKITQINGAIERLKARYKTQLADKSYMENNPDSIGKKVMDAIDRELLRRKIERKGESQ